MRIFLVLAAAAVVSGGLISVIKVSNVNGSERLLKSYRTDPQKTLMQIESAIFECVPGSAQSSTGSRFAGAFLAPFYVKIVALRMERVSRETIGAQVQKWIKASHQKILSLPAKDFLELMGYLKALEEDDVENCILSSAS
ncbi:hypothetical protein [Neorhizobium alkalisoli]|uniref:hypothetical protein n=1 Tax=Neorhizobium alkalisoli TaxID=528178 RepID=UPI000CF9EB56|nr:hypothetical protein [Neorhizobium alkalisoli]